MPGQERLQRRFGRPEGKKQALAAAPFRREFEGKPPRPRPPIYSIFKEWPVRLEAPWRCLIDLTYVRKANRPCKSLFRFFRNLPVGWEPKFISPPTSGHIGERSASVKAIVSIFSNPAAATEVGGCRGGALFRASGAGVKAPSAGVSGTLYIGAHRFGFFLDAADAPGNQVAD